MTWSETKVVTGCDRKWLKQKQNMALTLLMTQTTLIYGPREDCVV